MFCAQAFAPLSVPEPPAQRSAAVRVRCAHHPHDPTPEQADAAPEPSLASTFAGAGSPSIAPPALRKSESRVSLVILAGLVGQIGAWLLDRVEQVWRFVRRQMQTNAAAILVRAAAAANATAAAGAVGA